MTLVTRMTHQASWLEFRPDPAQLTSIFWIPILSTMSGENLVNDKMGCNYTRRRFSGALPVVFARVVKLVPGWLEKIWSATRKLWSKLVKPMIELGVNIPNYHVCGGEFPPSHQIITKLDRKVLLDDILPSSPAFPVHALIYETAYFNKLKFGLRILSALLPVSYSAACTYIRSPVKI